MVGPLPEKVTCRDIGDSLHFPDDEPNRFSPTLALKLLPAYAGVASIEEVLLVPRATRLLWLEMLVNEHVDLTAWQDHPDVQAAYAKACHWYTAYRSVLSAILSCHPLPHNLVYIDFREYRIFAEAFSFVAAHR